MVVYVKKASRPIARRSKKVLGAFSSLCFLIGLGLILQAIWPIVSWYLFVFPSVSNRIISPLASTFGSLVRAAENESYQPASWFTNAATTLSSQNSALRSYTLTIPKLKISAASVEVGGDLKKSLVAWPTSALPGGFGNNIIFGHSELPQFASPKDYSGIFTFLMDLEKGDVIFVDYDRVRYQYNVTDKKIVEANDLSVLEQRFDTGYVTLITCVPPGTLWKRGVIKAKLVRV